MKDKGFRVLGGVFLRFFHWKAEISSTILGVGVLIHERECHMCVHELDT